MKDIFNPVLIVSICLGSAGCSKAQLQTSEQDAQPSQAEQTVLNHDTGTASDTTESEPANPSWMTNAVKIGEFEKSPVNI